MCQAENAYVANSPRNLGCCCCLAAKLCQTLSYSTSFRKPSRPLILLHISTGALRAPWTQEQVLELPERQTQSDHLTGEETEAQRDQGLSFLN